MPRRSCRDYGDPAVRAAHAASRQRPPQRGRRSRGRRWRRGASAWGDASTSTLRRTSTSDYWCRNGSAASAERSAVVVGLRRIPRVLVAVHGIWAAPPVRAELAVGAIVLLPVVLLWVAGRRRPRQGGRRILVVAGAVPGASVFAIGAGS